jgi:type II secretory pathway pseudopilin PulG
MIRRNAFKFYSGQSMVEMLIALGIAVLIIVALVQSIVTTVKNSQFAKNQTLATRFGQEGIEKIRAQRDILGWMAFYATYNGKTLCVGSGGSSNWSDKPPTGCSVNIQNFFTREVAFTDVGGGNQLYVVVTTFWTDNNVTHKSEQRTYLSKW